MTKELEERFKKAVDLINSPPKPGAPKINIDMKKKLAFYALYKQATDGKCNVPAPSKTDMAGTFKHREWAKLGDLSKHDAMKKYLELAASVAPEEQKSKI